MDYQNLLKLLYVISLIYSLVNYSQCVLDSSNIIKIQMHDSDPFSLKFNRLQIETSR